MAVSRRILGLDYGARRIGVAISDPLGITAQPLCTLKNKKDQLLESLARLIEERQVGRVVLGLPLHMHGEESAAARDVRDLGGELAARTGVAVEYIDERLTTVIAQRVLTQSGMSGAKKRNVVDKLAATVILQTWLDRKSQK